MTQNEDSTVPSAGMSGEEKTVSLLRSNNIHLRLETPKGRGIFASAPILARTVLDVSPVLLFKRSEYENHLQYSCIKDYAFTWPGTAHQPPVQALPLGLGSLFNHAKHSSFAHNVGWTFKIEETTIQYITLRDIAKDEELCICYGEVYWVGQENQLVENSEDETGGSHNSEDNTQATWFLGGFNVDDELPLYD